MIDDQPEIETPVAPVAPFEVPERVPFWGYNDVFLFFGLALPCIVVAQLLVAGALLVFRLDTHNKGLLAMPAMFIAYILLFVILYAILQVQYGRPFWKSLAFTGYRHPLAALAGGWVLAIVISQIGILLRIPDTDNPMKELFNTRASAIAFGVFATTLGPLAEEIIFRGFLQPVLIRSLGVVAGVIATAVPFGLLHLQQYAFSWRHALLITIAGVAFGWMRQSTGSTRASAWLHAGYNSTFFLALLAAGSHNSIHW